MCTMCTIIVHIICELLAGARAKVGGGSSLRLKDGKKRAGYLLILYLQYRRTSSFLKTTSLAAAVSTSVCF